jgi:hypothetical protein
MYNMYQLTDRRTFLSPQRLLDVSDLCDARPPDERSVMTYVASFFHAFSSMSKLLYSTGQVLFRASESDASLAGSSRQGRDGRATSGKVCDGHAGHLVKSE